MCFSQMFLKIVGGPKDILHPKLFYKCSGQIYCISLPQPIYVRDILNADIQRSKDFYI